MNYDRIYEYRFRGVDAERKRMVWTEISAFMYEKLNAPTVILDPAAGQCEFINTVPSNEMWAIDMNEEFLAKHASVHVKKIIGNSLEVAIPDGYFEGVFISNFLEHLNSQFEVADFLKRMYDSLKKGGRIAVIGPNFKYCSKEYFDFADHTVILSDLALCEHLFAAGFEIVENHPRFLPLSFRGNLPVNKLLVKMYLSSPVFWSFFGKQFLVIAEKK